MVNAGVHACARRRVRVQDEIIGILCRATADVAAQAKAILALQQWLSACPPSLGASAAGTTTVVIADSTCGGGGNRGEVVALARASWSVSTLFAVATSRLGAAGWECDSRFR